MKNYRRLFLVDGDSFIYKALSGIHRLGEGDKVLIFVAAEAVSYTHLCYAGIVIAVIWGYLGIGILKMTPEQIAAAEAEERGEESA